MVFLLLAEHIRVLEGNVLIRPIEQHLLRLLVHAVPRRVRVIVVRRQESRDRPHPVGIRVFRERCKDTVCHAERRVWDDERRVKLLVTAEPRTDRARAEWAVEREHARCDLGQRNAAVHTGEILTEHEELAVHHLYVDHALTCVECRLQ